MKLTLTVALNRAILRRAQGGEMWPLSGCTSATPERDATNNGARSICDAFV